jgi:uncharacterized protein YdaU (DUF1376 family)
MTDKKTSPCFPMYPSDFFGDPNVRLMDGYEQAFYVILLMNMWQNVKGEEMPFLPNDDQKLARLLKISVKDWKKVKNSIFDCLKVSNDKIESPRLSREKLKQDKYRELQSEKGKKGGRPIKAKESNGFLPVKPDESQGIIPVKLPNPNPNPNPNPKKAISESPVDNSPSVPEPPPVKNAFLKDMEKEFSEVMDKIKAKYSFKEQMEIQNWIKSNYRGKHPKALIHTLNAIVKIKHKPDAITIYLDHIIIQENQNYNYEDYQKKAEEFKKPGVVSLEDIFKKMGFNTGIKSMPATA